MGYKCLVSEYLNKHELVGRKQGRPLHGKNPLGELHIGHDQALFSSGQGTLQNAVRVFENNFID